MPDKIAFAAAPLLVFKVGQLIVVEGGVAVVPSEPHSLKRADGSPHQPGDVLSVQASGEYQVRPANTIGPWETAVVARDYLVYKNYEGGQLHVIPFVALV